MTYCYRDSSVLLKWLLALLAIGALLDLVGVLSSISEYSILQQLARGEGLTDGQADGNDSRQAFIGGAQMLLYLVTVVFFCLWTYRMSANAHSVSDRSRLCSPGWAVGYYFVPVINLWRPVQALSDIYERFLDRTGSPAKGWLLPAWWSVFILAAVIGRIAFQMARSPDTIEDYIALSVVSIAADAVSIVLDCLAYLVVSTVTAAGVHAYRRTVGLDDPSKPKVVDGRGNPFLQGTTR